MAAKSSNVSKIIVGFFIIVIFPTIALVVKQGYLGGSTDTLFTIAVHNYLLASDTNPGSHNHANNQEQSSLKETSDKTTQSDQAKQQTQPLDSKQKPDGKQQEKEQQVKHERKQDTTEAAKENNTTGKPPQSLILRPTLAERVNNNPEQFLGKTLVFDRLLLSGTIGNPGPRRGHCTLTLATETGQLIERKRKDDRNEGLSCYVPEDLGRALGAALEPAKKYLVRMTCTVEQYMSQGVPFYRGQVAHLSLLDVRGSSNRTFRSQQPQEQLEIVSIQDVVTYPDQFEGKTFVIDQVPISGEIRRRQAHPGYHLKLDTGNGRFVYQINGTWNGFIITPSMGKQMMADVPTPSMYIVRITCQLSKQRHWHANVFQIDFFDSQRKRIVKSIK